MNLLKMILRPLANTYYCAVCGTWYDPSDPQGNWNHHH